MPSRGMSGFSWNGCHSSAKGWSGRASQRPGKVGLADVAPGADRVGDDVKSDHAVPFQPSRSARRRSLLLAPRGIAATRMNSRGDLVARQPGVEEGGKSASGRSRVGGVEGGDHDGVGLDRQFHRGAVVHPGMRVQRRFHLDRRDAEAAGVHHVVVAAEIGDGAVRVLRHHVAGQEPVAAEPRRGLVGRRRDSRASARDPSGGPRARRACPGRPAPSSPSTAMRRPGCG